MFSQQPDKVTLIMARLIANKLVRLSVVPFLGASVGYGVGLILGGDWPQAAGLALAVFGVVGLAEVAAVYHQAHRVELIEALDVPEHAAETGRWLNFLDQVRGKGDWKPAVLEEKTHRGMVFRAVGAEEFPFPLMVGGPLCPKCKDPLQPRVKTVLPAFVYRFCYRCAGCGFESCQRVSPAELFREAKRVCRLPV